MVNRKCFVMIMKKRVTVSLIVTGVILETLRILTVYLGMIRNSTFYSTHELNLKSLILSWLDSTINFLILSGDNFCSNSDSIFGNEIVANNSGFLSASSNLMDNAVQSIPIPVCENRT